MRPPTPQILDFGGGFWILGILDFGFWGFEILDFWGVWILDFGAGIPNPKSKIPNPNFFGQIFWILDFGSLCSNSLCEAPTPHILDFGGDFEFWILEVGERGKGGARLVRGLNHPPFFIYFFFIKSRNDRGDNGGDRDGPKWPAPVRGERGKGLK